MWELIVQFLWIRKSKAIMVRTKLDENKNRYTKQGNLCVTLSRESKRESFLIT